MQMLSAARRMGRVGVLTLMAVSVVAGAQQAKQRDVFAPIMEKLVQSTTMPVRVPEKLPFSDGGDVLYANIQSADKAGYQIEVGTDPLCEGGHACHYGTFYGSRKPFADLAQLKSVPVPLANGVRGTYARPTYGAYCSGSYLLWSQSGFFYGITMKCSPLTEMQRVANSAILSKRASAERRR
jgi:hypothetical protein